MNIPLSGAGKLQEAGIFTDLSGLQKIKQLPKGESEEALKAVAKQFESIFVNMMMKSMRDSNAVFEEDSLFGSNEQKFYRDMFDQQLALTMSSGNGIGLADVLARQLSKSYGTAAEPQAAAGSMPLTGAPKAEAKLPVEDVVFDSPQAFVEYLYPKAEKVAQKVGVDPRYMVAQAALETGWGQHTMKKSDGANSFNLFGIKADTRWDGEVARVSTLEYRDGIARREQANFRAYSSFEESLDDYIDFIESNERYQKALSVAQQPEQFVQELQRAGYATDPAYAEKISDIARRSVFARVDARTEQQVTIKGKETT